jgi:hypothetical protein
VTYRRRCRHSVCWALFFPTLFVPLVYAAGADPAEEGEEYIVTPEPDQTQRKFEINLSPLFLKGKFDAGEEEAMDAYYTRYVFPCWITPKNYPHPGDQLPDLRKKLHVHLAAAGRAPVQDVHDHLNAITLDAMNKLANANYRPAVRINAMFMIGELNAVEPALPRVKAQPLPAALPVLLKNIDDPKQIEAVKVAAMVGVIRHAAAGIEEADPKRQVTAAMLKLLGTPGTDGPAGQGHAWLQAQAAEALGLLGAAGAKGEVAAALAALAGDAKASFPTRCAAAEALGHLTYGPGVNVEALLAALCRMAIDAAGDEDPSTSVLVRMLKWRMHSIGAGLTGLDSAVPAQDRALFDSLKEGVEKLMKLDADEDRDVLIQSVHATRGELEKLLRKLSK